jgi:hypothetical protein
VDGATAYQCNKEARLAMKSSQRTGFRTFVVAGFLLATPLVAAFQGSIQDLIQRALGSTSPKTTTVAQSVRSDAPAFRPLVNGTSRPGDSSLDRSIGKGSAEERTHRFSDHDGDLELADTVDKAKRVKDLRDSIAQEGSRSPADAARQSDEGRLATRPADRSAFDAVQTEYQERTLPPDRVASVRAEVGSRTGTPNNANARDGYGRRAADAILAEGGGTASESARYAADPVDRQYDRLRHLGATSSRLETWGPQGDRFRFQCRVATGDDPTEARHFEATDSQPLRAIEKVTAQVEDWRGQRR